MGVFWKANVILEQRYRLGSRAGLSSSTSRSKGVLMVIGAERDLLHPVRIR